MERYDHAKIEEKWQKEWEKQNLYRADDSSSKKKFYGLIEFPYPSGAGLHVGHIRSNTAMDIIARKRRSEGFEVLYPIGWDAFGLPTENYAIKTGRPPAEITKENTDIFRRQLKSLGFSFDWSREVNTTDPAYYKWTQWIFLQMHRKGLAYKAKMAINWCPKDKIGLANEEVINGVCERCGTPVEKREKEQWMLAITKYADRLDKDLDLVDYQDRIKIQQRNWIGRSEGAEIEFPVAGSSEKIKVFTTRADTLFGATYVVLAPEHELVQKLKPHISNSSEVEAYAAAARNKADIDRAAEGKEKTGIELKGVKAVNPGTKEEIPVWIADYVLAHYGTGAIMAVPAHDERDFEFAKKFSLPVKEVVIPKLIDRHDPPVEGKKTVFRHAIQVMLIDPKADKVLMLKWKKFPWTTFITGGIDDGEDPVKAAEREIIEETGYKNVRFVKNLGGPIESHFFAAHKDENRKALFTCMEFELVNDERNPVSEDEQKIHDVVWMSWDELKADKNIKCSEYEIMLDRHFNPPHPWTEEGVLINSGKFDGMSTEESRKVIAEEVGGSIKVSYKLRDWVFSRQRYWGEPIPMISCEKCGWQPVPESELPVKLPEVKNYQPTDTGESPLAGITEWVNTKCPKCGGEAKRETDTMPNWAGSSWYFLRYADPQNGEEFASKEKLHYWMPVDWYNGGMEHTTLHLLYSRFWHKFLFDEGLVSEPEPFKKRTSHGVVLAEDGARMSKSRGNVINPDEVAKNVGADTLRVYEMFMGPFDQPIAWSTDNMVGSRRFIERIWKLREKVKPEGSALAEALVHRTIQKVSDDIEEMGFNTAVSALMILLNEFERLPDVSQAHYEIFLKLVSGFAPHVTEELWQSLGHSASIHLESWPAYDPQKMESGEAEYVFQVNGKVRGSVRVSRDASEEEVRAAVLNEEEGRKWLEGKEVAKAIFVKGRLINFVIKGS